MNRPYLPTRLASLVGIFVSLFCIGTCAQHADGAVAALPANSDIKNTLESISASLAPGQWHLVPNTIEPVLPSREEIGKTTWGNSGPKAVIKAWTGAAFDPQKMRMYFHGGGHANYGGNGVYQLDLIGMAWSRLSFPYVLPPASAAQPCPQPTEVEHGPRASHTYDALVWSSVNQRIIYWNARGYCHKGKPPPDPFLGTWQFEVENGSWEFRERVPLYPMTEDEFTARVGRTSTAELADGSIVIADAQGVYQIDPSDFSILKEAKSSNWGLYHQLVYSEQRDELYLNSGNRLYILDVKTLRIKEVVKKPPDAQVSRNAGMAYYPPGEQLVFWEGADDIVVYDLKLEQWRWHKAASTKAPFGMRPWSKWIYLDDFNLFVGVSKYDEGIWFYRLPEWSELRKLPAISLQEQIDQQPGLTVKISPDYYRIGAVIKRSGVTIDGGGSFVTGVVRAKGVFLVKGDGVTIENFEIALGEGNWVNDACLRIEGSDAHIRDIQCHHTQMGILAGGRAGELLIERVAISSTGINPRGNLGHALYLCSNKKCEGSDRVIVRDSSFTDIGIRRPGHIIKSRAPYTLVENNSLRSGEGRTGRHLELPSGGSAVFRGNTFVQQRNADNEDILSFGKERHRGLAFGVGVAVSNNHFVCEKTSRCFMTEGDFQENDRVVLSGNTTEGPITFMREKTPHVMVLSPLNQ